MALVGGVAAKKLGLFALVAALYSNSPRSSSSAWRWWALAS